MASQNPLMCYGCNTPVTATGNFCSNCGCNLRVPPGAQQPQQLQTRPPTFHQAWPNQNTQHWSWENQTVFGLGELQGSCLSAIQAARSEDGSRRSGFENQSVFWQGQPQRSHPSATQAAGFDNATQLSGSANQNLSGLQQPQILTQTTCVPAHDDPNGNLNISHCDTQQNHNNQNPGNISSVIQAEKQHDSVNDGNHANSAKIPANEGQQPQESSGIVAEVSGASNDSLEQRNKAGGGHELMGTTRSAEGEGNNRQDGTCASYAEVTSGGSNLANSEKGHVSYPPKEHASSKENTRSTAVINIRFYAVISLSDFKFDPKTHELHVRFQPNFLGGFTLDPNRPQWILRKCREREDSNDLVIFETTVPVPKKFVTGNSSMLYKYVVKDKDGKAHWEYLTNGTRSNEGHINRSIGSLPYTKEEYFHYDGALHRKPEGFVERATRAWQNITDTASENITKRSAGAMGMLLTMVTDDYLDNPEATAAVYWKQLFRVLTAAASTYDEKHHPKVLQIFLEGFPEYVARSSKSLQRSQDEKAQLVKLQAKILATTLVLINVSEKYQQAVSPEISHQYLCNLLLNADPPDKSCPAYAEMMKFHFKDIQDLWSITSSLRDTLLFFATDPCWILGLPIYHFLGRQSAPYHPLQTGVHHENDKWWGIEGLKECVKHTKEHLSTEQLHDYLFNLSPLFEADQLLARSVLAVTKLSLLPLVIESGMFPLDALLANLCYHIKTADKPNQTLSQVIAMLSDKIAAVRESGNLQETNYQSNIAVYATDVLRHFVNAKWSMPAKEEFFHLVNILLGATELSLYDGISQNEIRDLVEAAWKCVSTYLKSVLSPTFGYPASKEFEMLRSLLAVKIQHKIVEHNWNKKIMEYFTSRLLQGSDMDILKVCCLEDKNCLHEDMNKSLDERVQKIIKKTWDPTLGEFLSYMKSHKKDITDGTVQFLSALFTNMWPECDATDHSLLVTVLQTDLCINFLDLYVQHNGPYLFHENCRMTMDRVISIFSCLTEALMQGKSTCSQIDLLVKKEGAAMDMLKIAFQHPASEVKGHLHKHMADASGDGNSEYGVFQKVLEWRQKEMEYFTKKHSALRELVTCCNDMPFKVDAASLDKVVNLDVESVPVDTLWDPLIYHPALSKEDSCVPRILFLSGLSQSFHQALDDIPKLLASSLFQKCLKGSVRQSEVDEEYDLSLNNVVENIWSHAKEEWLSIQAKLNDGTITCREFDQYFSDISNQSLPDLRKELSKVVSEVFLDERMAQIELYHKTESYIDAASLLQAFREQYQLLGDFSALEPYLIKEIDKEKEIRSFDKLTTGEDPKMDDFKSERIKVLRAFLACRPLLDWAKDHVPDRRQLTALVELAMDAAAGQGDLDVERVSCLQAAMMGYAPLFYDLKQKHGFDDLWSLFRKVWTAWECDHHLHTKLVNTNDSLEWLKQLRQSYVSMEASALSQIQAINATGTFIVGMAEPRKAATDLERIVTVTVNKDERSYSYAELKDLQSKLMLIADKKHTETMDTFVSVFNAICSLGEIFIQLSQSGSILFDNWSFHFSPDLTEVSFGMDENKSFFEAHASTLNQVTAMSRFLEDCLKQWTGRIEVARTSFYNLNYFTTRQLVFLRKQLAHIYKSQARRTKLDPHLFSLLYSVDPHCDDQDIKHALLEAFEFLAADEVDDEAKERNQEEYQAFLAAINEGGYSPEDARRASKKFRPDEAQEAILWLMGQEDSDEDIVGRDNSHMLRDESFHSMTENLYEQSREKTKSIMERLLTMWQRYMDEFETTIGDCISIPHLGQTLEHLANIGSHPLDRKFPASLKKGQPNLIVCAQNEVLSTLCTIYMESASCPLPSCDEVLMCTENTTAEQVELLWQKAYGDAAGDRYGRIYCLVNADQLRAQVCEKLEECLQSHEALQCSSYQLVVICSHQGEDRSHIVNILHPHRVSYHQFYQPEEIHGYLQEHLTSNGDHRSAGSLDPEKSTVRLVKSLKPGLGKSLWIERIQDKLKRNQDYEKISLHNKHVNEEKLAVELLAFATLPNRHQTRVFHLDLAHYVESGVDHALFSLLVLGSITDEEGRVWRKHPSDLYLIECVPLTSNLHTQNRSTEYVHSVLHLLPSMMCWSPVHCHDLLRDHITTESKLRRMYPLESVNLQVDQLVDEKLLLSEKYRRPVEFLHPGPNLDLQMTFLESVLMHCGIEDPSWAELRRFLDFLYCQLEDFYLSPYCGEAGADILPGFSNFVRRFLILMAKDFATKSLHISEESPNTYDASDVAVATVNYELKRTWENSPHPYIFFNKDRTFSFFGFHVNEESGMLINQKDGTELDIAMVPNLRQALLDNKVPFNEDFDALEREEKLGRLLMVMGRDYVVDPDPTYELTMDNIIKILAIHMRFRCGIPVLIMGETGSGKTRMIQFMCDMFKPIGCPDARNMILMKMHGGTKEEDVRRKLEEATTLAQQNLETYGPDIPTVLFFDEANTTEAVGLIKEIMCDQTFSGRHHADRGQLHLVAACNPYRKHNDDMIRRLEAAGLGYRVRAEETRDTLGKVPLRQLVYRVHALPHSLVPLIWDFGELSDEAELLYIQQMVMKALREEDFQPYYAPVMSEILAACQQYMRGQKNEVSFVSLRDVERALKVMRWFYHNNILHDLMDKSTTRTRRRRVPESSDSDDDLYDPAAVRRQQAERIRQMTRDQEVKKLRKSLILAIGVCYQASLESRAPFRQSIAKKFRHPFHLTFGARIIRSVIDNCQQVFLEGIKLGPNIAKNHALRENIFMIVVCIELRIPLFLVGKPGSSKSLAKTIVKDAMMREQSTSKLFKSLKKIQMVTFQCSQLSKPKDIISTFNHCAKLQKDHSDQLDQFASVVVLDEIGLAEDSPQMPLKTLHPLLENGCIDDEEVEPYKKVAFIGISNWALDPAKMNRGILVQRHAPDEKELENSAMGICGGNKDVLNRIQSLIPLLTKAYLQMYESKPTDKSEEFFGLRDFYSLVKMVYSFAEKYERRPTKCELRHAVLRNFGGVENINPLEAFSKAIASAGQNKESEELGCSIQELVHASLTGAGLKGDRRYLLLLTENYAALDILHETLLANQKATVIFGSSFPKDQEYTQVCRNIHRIRICMQAGHTVILLNLENIYESLYDALNQYYLNWGDQKYVDVGLGTHRVKCLVHNNFRLVVVAEKQTVYNQFPIPLINRLEKHLLSAKSLLSPQQSRLSHELTEWVNMAIKPVHPSGRSRQPSVRDAFIGFHDDTPSLIILEICKRKKVPTDDLSDETLGAEILLESKRMLLQIASPESMIRLRQTSLQTEEVDSLTDVYFDDQAHGSLADFLSRHFTQDKPLFAKISTHGQLLAEENLSKLPCGSSLLLHLQQFETEEQFTSKIERYLQGETGHNLLIVQCDSGESNYNLIACAQHHLDNMSRETSVKSVIILVKLPKASSTSNYLSVQGSKWMSYHIEELVSTKQHLPPLHRLIDCSVSDLLSGYIRPANDEDSVHVQTHNDSETSLAEEESAEISLDNEEGLGGASAAEGKTVDDFDEGAFNDSFTSNDSQTAPRPEREVVPEAAAQHSLFDDLIESCLHAAVSKIEIPAGHLPKPELVQLLSQLLSRKDLVTEDTGLTFIDVLQRRIVSVMKDGEKTRMSYEMTADWLIQSVATTDAVTEAGTFRQAGWNYLEKRVTPILTGLISFISTNNNVALALANEQHTWAADLWLEMFSDTNLSKQTGREQNSQETYSVKTVGVCAFEPKLPFSWIIKQRVDDLLHQQPSEIDPDQSHVACRLLVDTFGPVLRCVPMECLVDLTRFYLHDFVCMMYKPQCSGDNRTREYKIVEQIVKVTVQKLSQTDDDDDDDDDDDAGPVYKSFTRIMLFHLAYNKTRKLTNLLRETLKILPQILDRLDQPQEDNTEPFHTLLLTCILESLNPQVGKKLDSSEGRMEWYKRVECCQSCVESLLELMWDDEGVEDSLDKNYKLRCLWVRVQVLHMFVRHMCPMDLRCMPLWATLGEEADFTKTKSLIAVENFLKLCNKTTYKDFNKKQNCPSCKEETCNLVELPCRHKFCWSCVVEWQSNKRFKCDTCEARFPRDMEIPENDPKKRYSIYKQKSEAFFMELVMRLCFYGNKPAEDQVVVKLFDYIIRPPSDQPPEELLDLERMDVTPVVQSFLLQLLFSSRREMAFVLMDRHFNRASDAEAGRLHHLQTLCVHTLQDLYMNKVNQDSVSLPAASHQLLSAAYDPLTHGDDVNMSYLDAVAQARCGLMLVVACIHDVMNRQSAATVEQRRMLDVARRVCDVGHQGADHISCSRLFLMRLLLHHHSLNLLMRTSNIIALNWIIPPALLADEDTPVPDRFVVCGERYQQIRETLVEVTLGSDPDDTIECEGDEELLLLLAAHREVVSVSSNIQESSKEKTTAVLLTYLQHHWRDNLGLHERLLHNRIGPGLLDLSEDHEGIGCDLSDLLVHLHLVVNTANRPWPALLSPLFEIACEPGSSQGKFLPTMPDNHTDDVRQALLNARETHYGDRNPFVWLCPNGHPYVIGDCGRPYFEGTCNVCGSVIGGHGHRPARQNTQAATGDLTKTGYILGPAHGRDQQAAPERDLSATATVALRMLLHLCMYLGACHAPQDICAIIETDGADRVTEDNVRTFIEEHLLIDVEMLGKVTGCSRDDVFVIMHLAVHRMTVSIQGDAGAVRLTNRQMRRDWERAFSELYMAPVIQKLREKLQHATDMISRDRRLANNPLLCRLYEVKGSAETTDHHHLWRVHPTLSLNTVLQELNELSKLDQLRMQFLKAFLEQAHMLAAVKYIPDIVLLQRRLTARFNGNIRIAEAESMTIAQMIHATEADSSRAELRRLFSSMQAAWEAVRSSMKDAVFGAERQLRVHEAWCREPLSDRSSLLMLLPTSHGRGACSVGLLHFLCQTQNELIELHTRVMRSSEPRTVEVSEASASELIAVPQSKSMHLLFRQFSTTALSHTHSLQTDFDGLQNNISVQFVKNRPRLKAQIPEVVFQDDLHIATLFAQLEANIPQVEQIPGKDRSHIDTEFTGFPDLCKAVHDLEIAIGYMVATSVATDESLETFMTDKLHMTHSLSGTRAGQCSMDQVKALWLTLVYNKSRHLALLNEDPFRTVTGQVPFDDHGELMQETEVMFTAASNVHLKSFMRILFEFIVLEIRPEHLSHPLGECLEVFHEDITTRTGLKIPEAFLGEHSSALWQTAMRYLHGNHSITA